MPRCTGCAAVPYIKYTSFSLNYTPNKTENTVTQGSAITYKCSVGTLQGPAIVTCINSLWRQPLPSCLGFFISYSYK